MKKKREMQEKKEHTRINLEVEQESNLKLGIQVDLGLKTIPSHTQTTKFGLAKFLHT